MQELGRKQMHLQLTSALREIPASLDGYELDCRTTACV